MLLFLAAVESSASSSPSSYRWLRNDSDILCSIECARGRLSCVVCPLFVSLVFPIHSLFGLFCPFITIFSLPFAPLHLRTHFLAHSFGTFFYIYMCLPIVGNSKRMRKNDAHFTDNGVRQSERAREKEVQAHALSLYPRLWQTGMPSMKWSTFITIIINTAFTCQWSERFRNKKENNKFVDNTI